MIVLICLGCVLGIAGPPWPATTDTVPQGGPSTRASLGGPRRSCPDTRDRSAGEGTTEEAQPWLKGCAAFGHGRRVAPPQGRDRPVDRLPVQAEIIEFPKGGLRRQRTPGEGGSSGPRKTACGRTARGRGTPGVRPPAPRRSRVSLFQHPPTPMQSELDMGNCRRPLTSFT